MNMTFLDPRTVHTARLDLESRHATPDGQGGAVLTWTVARLAMGPHRTGGLHLRQ